MSMPILPRLSPCSWNCAGQPAWRRLIESRLRIAQCELPSQQNARKSRELQMGRGYVDARAGGCCRSRPGVTDNTTQVDAGDSACLINSQTGLTGEPGQPARIAWRRRLSPLSVFRRPLMSRPERSSSSIGTPMNTATAYRRLPPGSEWPQSPPSILITCSNRWPPAGRQRQAPFVPIAVAALTPPSCCEVQPTLRVFEMRSRSCTYASGRVSPCGF